MLPPRLQQVFRKGRALQQSGRIAEAAVLYRQVRAGAPGDFDAWHQGGMAALLLGQAEEAAKLLAQALRLQPGSTPTAFGLGVAHVARGDLPGAEAVLRAVTKSQPKLAEAWHYLALVFETQGRTGDALAARRRVTALNPHYAAGWTALGATLSNAGHQTEALSCFSKALAIDGTDARARLGRAMTFFKCYRVPEAVAEYSALLALDPGQFEARSFRLMALNSLPDWTRDALLAEHAAYGRAAGPAIRTAWLNAADPGRRLRVAFLSPDLRAHAVAYFLEPLLQHLDPAVFEIVLYHDHAQVDDVSERLRAGASLWRNFAGRTDEMLEAAILADAPDILVDLAGHTGTSRLRALARRLAPVQVSCLGYPNTTGVAAMDYRLVDAITDPPPEADRFATEKLVRFAPTAWAYRPPDHAPDVAPPPSAANGFVTFGVFNNLTKATDNVFAWWARLLAVVPNSRLLIKAAGLAEPAVRAPLLARLRAAGLPEARLDLLDRTPDARSHLEAYRRVDIALDTFPYHGTTTTCEALWMGVPVVTRAGDRHISRVGASLLTAAGHPEWIAYDEHEYISIAAALAADPGRLVGLRRNLRADLRRGPLLDHPAQASRFGAALRSCWQQWCSAVPSTEGAISAACADGRKVVGEPAALGQEG